jgi:type I restriction enzyme M protein
MLTHCRIIASVDLHPDTFQPRNGTQTSVLLLQKKTEIEMQREAVQGQILDYEMFMAQVTAIGHDKRGNKMFRRNSDGEEILEPVNVEAIEHTAAGHITTRPLPRAKILDDDTPIIAQEFLHWKQEAILGW